MTSLFVGTMSGTSMDGVDAVLVDFSAAKPVILGHHYVPLSDPLRAVLRHVAQPQGGITLAEFAALDAAMGTLIGTAVVDLLKACSTSSRSVRAIGSHGQTIFHAPQAPTRTSLQIGNPNIVSQVTGITTVADFRRRDVAAGGQGAPLVPAFHRHVFASSSENRVIVNIGGIGNITVLPLDSDHILGFDTGPGNCFLDMWCERINNAKYDDQGAWARTGKANQALLSAMLSDPFLAQSPPKSTGKEYFNAQWLTARLAKINDTPQNVQATLAEFTARSIVDAIKLWAPATDKIFVCGGGAHNAYLLERIAALSSLPVETTAQLGVEPTLVEAAAFAWLAMQTLERKPGNLVSVTGAAQPVVLGGIYYA